MNNLRNEQDAPPVVKGLIVHSTVECQDDLVRVWYAYQEGYNHHTDLGANLMLLTQKPVNLVQLEMVNIVNLVRHANGVSKPVGTMLLADGVNLMMQTSL